MKNVKSKIILTAISLAVCGGFFLSTSTNATIEEARAAVLAGDYDQLERALADGTKIEDVATTAFFNELHEKRLEEMEEFLLNKAAQSLYKKNISSIRALIAHYYPGLAVNIPDEMPVETHFPNKTLNGGKSLEWYAKSPAAQRAFDRVSDVVVEYVLPELFKFQETNILSSDESFVNFLEFVGKIRQAIQANAEGENVGLFGTLCKKDITDSISAPKGTLRNDVLRDVYSKFKTAYSYAEFHPQYTINLNSRDVEPFPPATFGGTMMEMGSDNFQLYISRSYNEYTYPAHRKLITDILALAETPEEIETKLPDLLLELSYEFPWSGTYERGQAAILVWYLRSLARTLNYDLKFTGKLAFDAEGFPIDVEAFLAPDLETFKANCRDCLTLTSIS